MFWTMENPRPREIIVLVVVLAVCAVFAARYFSEEVFYLNTYQYKHSDAVVNGNVTVYRAKFSPDIRVEAAPAGGKTRVAIGADSHLVWPIEGEREAFFVEYPDGVRHKAVSTGHFLMGYDEKGDPVFPGGLYIDGKKHLSPGEKLYAATSIVHAAYEQYHTKRGIPLLYIFGNLFFVFSWAMLRYQKLQDIYFYMTYGLWVENPEPSDNYYIASMLGAIAGMIISVGLVIFKAF